MAKAVQCLLSIHKALDSILTTANEQTNIKQEITKHAFYETQWHKSKTIS
jgi:hypothetical protein